MCLVPLTVLILELTWVQENLSDPTNTLSNEPTTKGLTLPSQELANQIPARLSDRATTIANFDVGTPSRSRWRKIFKFEKSFKTQKNAIEGERQKNEKTKPTINHHQS